MITRATLLRLLLIVAALPAAIGAIRSRPPRFANVAPALPAHSVLDPAPYFKTESLPAAGTAFVHGATLAELPNGDLAAAFYGGSDETRRDVAIYLTIRDRRSGRWSAPRVVVDREQAQRELRMPVKSVGNPVLYADARGVRLFFVAIVVGGWSASTTAVKSSADAVRWSAARHVITSPFFDAGMLVRGAPVAYDDGTLALPVYQELGVKWPAIVRVDRAGRVVDEVRVDGRQVIQPWIVPTSDRDAVVFFRQFAKWGALVTIPWASTHDGGSSFSSVAATPLAHRDSAVAAMRAADGSILVIWNNSPYDRRNISIVRGFDGLRRWSRPYAFISDGTPDWSVHREYSYPFVIRTRDGRIHFVFTYQRSAIHHIVFNDAWIETHPLLSEAR